MKDTRTRFRGWRPMVAALSAAALLAACGGGGGGGSEGPGEDLDAEGSSTAMTDYAAGDQFRAQEPVEFSILWTDWPATPVEDSWILFDEIEERTNVRLNLTHIPFSDHQEKRSLLISAGEAPDIIPLVYTGEEEQWAASGAALPISEYEDHMPHFQNYVDEWDTRDMVDNLRQADGKYYMMPGLQEVSVPVFSLIIRKDIFDEVGAPHPESWDDLRTGLELIKEAYPDSLPLADGFEGGSMLNYAAHPFGTVGGWGYGRGVMFDEESDQFVYAGTSDEYRDMVQYFRELADAGLLDTESFTETNDGAGTVQEKFAAGEVFAASGAAGTVNEFAVALDQTVGEGNYELLQVAPPAGPAGAIVEPRNFWHGFMITSQAAEDPDFLTLLQFLDWLYYSPEARELVQWGVEGETYTKDNGQYTLDPNHSYESNNLNVGAETDIQVDLGFGSHVLAGATESRELKESYNTEQFVEYIDAVLSNRTPRDPFPPAPFTEDELERASLLSTPLKDTVDTNTLAFIVGQRDLSEWDAYVAEVEAGGLSDYLDLVNGAYQRFADENS